MPRSLSPATAEQVVAVVEAVIVHGPKTEPDFVATFCDLPKPQAEAALNLATDLGLLMERNGNFTAASPLCRFLVTANLAQRAAVVRVLLESYVPFTTFRERLVATGDATLAARHTRTELDITEHRDQVKDTLISLGTYSDALLAVAGGRYEPQPERAGNPLEVLALAAADQAAAEGRIRSQLGDDAARKVSRDEVIVPLTNALLKANGGDPKGAVVEAGNALESYLIDLAVRANVGLTGATGINSKLDRFDTAHWLPKKLVFVGKHLGHVRNAADHGVDADVGASWTIRRATGLEYVFLACSFIAAVTSKELGRAEI